MGKAGQRVRGSSTITADVDIRSYSDLKGRLSDFGRRLRIDGVVEPPIRSE